MKDLVDKVLKLRENKLANKRCEDCIFKVVEYEDSPCVTCKYGRYAGEDKNFVRIENDL